MKRTSLASFIVGIVFGAAAIALIVLGICAITPKTSTYQFFGAIVTQSESSRLYRYADTFFMMGGFTMVSSILLFVLAAILKPDYCDCGCDCDEDGECIYDVENEEEPCHCCCCECQDADAPADAQPEAEAEQPAPQV